MFMSCQLRTVLETGAKIYDFETWRNSNFTTCYNYVRSYGFHR